MLAAAAAEEIRKRRGQGRGHTGPITDDVLSLWACRLEE